MKDFKNLDAYFVTMTAAEYDAGYVVWDSEISLDVLDHFISLRCPFPANTCGKTDAWTANPALEAKNTDEVDTVYVSPEELRQAGCESLYEYLFGENCEYPAYTSTGVYFSDGNIQSVSEALENFVEKQLPEDAVAQYLGLFS